MRKDWKLSKAKEEDEGVERSEETEMSSHWEVIASMSQNIVTDCSCSAISKCTDYCKEITPSISEIEVTLLILEVSEDSDEDACSTEQHSEVVVPVIGYFKFPDWQKSSADDGEDRDHYDTGYESSLHSEECKSETSYIEERTKRV